MGRNINLTNMFRRNEDKRKKEMNFRELWRAKGGYIGEVKDRESCCSDWCRIANGKTGEYRDYLNLN
ncbi:MAG: hypothetical protein GY765_11505 [bacterium]|nr:hypothetical protein [bacterium]